MIKNKEMENKITIKSEQMKYYIKKMDYQNTNLKHLF